MAVNANPTLIQSIDGKWARKVVIERNLLLQHIAHDETGSVRSHESLTPPTAGNSVDSNIYETVTFKDFDIVVVNDQADATITIKISENRTDWFDYDSKTGTLAIWERKRIPAQYFKVTVTAGASDITTLDVWVGQNP